MSKPALEDRLIIMIIRPSGRKSQKGVFMKSFVKLRGIVLLILLFGLTVLAYGQSLNGTWSNNDGFSVTLSNGAVNGFIADGSMSIPLYRGTYTTSGSNITITLTQLSGTFFSMLGTEMFMILNIGEDPFKLYSRNELGIRRGMESIVSRAQLNELLDMLFLTETCSVNNNQFTFMDFTFTKR